MGLPLDNFEVLEQYNRLVAVEKKLKADLVKWWTQNIEPEVNTILSLEDCQIVAKKYR